jgi:hypothetical protein
VSIAQHRPFAEEGLTAEVGHLERCADKADERRIGQGNVQLSGRDRGKDAEDPLDVLIEVLHGAGRNQHCNLTAAMSSSRHDFEFPL